MDGIWFELVFIFCSFLATAFCRVELAIVSARRGRMAQWPLRGTSAPPGRTTPGRPAPLFGHGANRGHTGRTMASAVGGATAVEVLKPLLQQMPLPIVRNAAEPLALILVVSLIAYLS